LTGGRRTIVTQGLSTRIVCGSWNFDLSGRRAALTHPLPPVVSTRDQSRNTQAPPVLGRPARTAQLGYGAATAVRAHRLQASLSKQRGGAPDERAGLRGCRQAPAHGRRTACAGTGRLLKRLRVTLRPGRSGVSRGGNRESRRGLFSNLTVKPETSGLIMKGWLSPAPLLVVSGHVRRGGAGLLEKVPTSLNHDARSRPRARMVTANGTGRDRVSSRRATSGQRRTAPGRPISKASSPVEPAARYEFGIYRARGDSADDSP